MTGASWSVVSAQSRLEREQAGDLRRSVLCGELHLSRAVVEDGLDQAPGAWLGLVCSGDKPVATLRLRLSEGQAQLEHLAVLALFRRQGLGRLLVKEALQRAQAAGVERCFAVGPSVADVFFTQQGFGIVQTQEGVSVWQRGLE